MPSYNFIITLMMVTAFPLSFFVGKIEKIVLETAYKDNNNSNNDNNGK